MKSDPSSNLGVAVQPLVCHIGRSCIGLFGFALLYSTAAAQQETLGAILDKGAMKLSAAELKAGLTSGKLPDAGQFDGLTYDGDGRVSGRYQNYPVNGEWTVDASGLLCGEWYTNFGNSWKACRFWFKLGETYYVVEAESDSDRTLRVQKAKSQ